MVQKKKKNMYYAFPFHAVCMKLFVNVKGLQSFKDQSARQIVVSNSSLNFNVWTWN